jgi:hypothetical protein
MPSKRVRIHYRRFFRGGEPIISETLSAAVAKALSHKVDGAELDTDVRLRTCEDVDYGSVILNGRFRAANGDVYGELVRFDPDTNIPLLVQNSSSTAELEIREAVKPNDAEVLQGMTFFMIRKDHVLVVEQGLTNPIFERYLRWLLCERTPVAQRNARVPLIPKLFLDEEVQSLRDVKMVRLRPAPLQVDTLFDADRTEIQSKEVEPTTNVLGILKAANFDTAVIENMMRLHGAAVELNLSITLKAGRSTLKMQGEEAVALLRNVPEDDLIVIGDGIRKNRGVLERLSEQVDIERKGNILVRKEAWNALRKAAASYRDAGLIE